MKAVVVVSRNAVMAISGAVAAAVMGSDDGAATGIGTVSTWVSVSAVTVAVAAGKQYGDGDRGSNGCSGGVAKKLRGYLRGAC